MSYTNRLKQLDSMVWLGDASVQVMHPYWDSAMTEEQLHYNPVNLCVAGDTIGRLNARLKDGLLDHCNPKVIILNIGMNDLAKMSPQFVAEGILNLVHLLRAQHPRAAIGIHALVPRGYRTPVRLRTQIEAVNACLRETALPANSRLIEMYDIFVGAKRRFSASDCLATVDFLPESSVDDWLGDELDTISMDISESAAFETLG